MPTYKNNGTVVRNIYLYGNVDPGATVQVPKYAWPIHPDFELVDHEPRANYPVKMYQGGLPSGTLTPLEAYGRLIISNQTTAAITVEFNDDNANAMSLPAGIITEMDLEKNYHSVALSGSGAGIVGVWACVGGLS